MGCSEDLAKLKECLKPKSFMEIINASATVPFPSLIPVVDGNFLPGEIVTHLVPSDTSLSSLLALSRTVTF